jgi:hypothetical protein
MPERAIGLPHGSASGFYELSGLLHLAGWSAAEGLLARLAAPAFLAAVAVLGVRFWKHPALAPRAGSTADAPRLAPGAERI